MNSSSIGQAAQQTLWRDMRQNAQRRLLVVTTVSVFYLLAAVAVGAYLIWMVRAIGQTAVYIDGWETKEYPTQWISGTICAYIALGSLVLIAYPFLILFIAGRLPLTLWCLGSWIPWIGSTGRMVTLADLCQSIHFCVLAHETYDQALETATKSICVPAIKKWTRQAASHVRAGHAFADVLATLPVRDLPLSAITVVLKENLTEEETKRIWYHAACESHRLVESRLRRTIQVLSITCVLVSVALAAFAMLSSGMFLRLMLQGLT